MALAPLFSSACDLAHRMPPLVAEFLELETHLRRRFREESITDLLVASLSCLPDKDLVVFFPKNETNTGEDFDLILFDPILRQAVQYRIQAKRLKPHPTNWLIGSYPELAHPHGTGKQSLSLVRSAAAEKRIRTIPLYAFYNPAGACDSSGGLLSGINLADGRMIRGLVRALIKAKPKRPPLKRLSTLQPLFFSLSAILCPPSGGLVNLSPAESLRSVTGAMAAATLRFIDAFEGVARPLLADARRHEKDWERALGSFEEPPPMLRKAMELRGRDPLERLSPARVPRPRVVLISSD